MIVLKAIELLVLDLAYRPIGDGSVCFVAEGFSYSWGHIYNVLLYEVQVRGSVHELSSTYRVETICFKRFRSMSI